MRTLMEDVARRAGKISLSELLSSAGEGAVLVAARAALASARAAAANKDWREALAAWGEAREAGVDEEKWRQGMARAHLHLARECEKDGDWDTARRHWSTLADLQEPIFADLADGGIRRSAFRGARKFEGEHRDAEALDMWRALLAAEPVNEPARKGVERLALRLARAAEAEGNFADAVDCWDDLAGLDAESERARRGLRRCLLRLARGAEEDHDWALGLTLWQEFERISPDDKRALKGVVRCAVRAVAAAPREAVRAAVTAAGAAA
jgi:tetratricopeptide (TPR) repeat protein